ncbi:Alpha/beta fold family hydrolase [Pseudomonas syringae pv. cilantro]|uniref:Alpha/beta fold family hydrolase n=3 Tax=Pseudomonas TaxID=286 RepID=A0A0N0GG80_PSESX|nr:Alpha/beta fold family hydrolase [Pseudomonas syringae pv. cilantro]KPW71429.1 Alpha/beta fold family hydrolase [Pseudomonas syringae pv. coriandricola]RMN15307.1 Alpha/beta fold family hydrolase [Pseudomonas syringae pv. coriandricola]
MMSLSKPDAQLAQSFAQAPNKTVNVAGIAFAYRETGLRGGVPVFLLNYWGAVLDDFDPRIVDGLAREHHVIAIDYQGAGLSDGIAPLTIDEMARDTLELIRTMGYERVDLIGFSMGGFVAQDLALKAPERVRTLILTGTGPAGGPGIERIGALSWPLILKGLLTLRDPKLHMFFTPTLNGQNAARGYLKRVKERATDRDKGPTPRLLFRQLKAIKAWGNQQQQDLARLRMPVLIVAGDSDIMISSSLSRTMARRIPQAHLVIYPDAGHGSVFQYHTDFVSKALAFLKFGNIEMSAL